MQNFPEKSFQEPPTIVVIAKLSFCKTAVLQIAKLGSSVATLQN